jgi:hypothetical protein
MTVCTFSDDQAAHLQWLREYQGEDALCRVRLKKIGAPITWLALVIEIFTSGDGCARKGGFGVER